VEKVSLIRNEGRDYEAFHKQTAKDPASAGLRSSHNPKELKQAIETQEMLEVAEAVIVSALRKESRGYHYRTDHPEMEDEWGKIS